MEKTGFLDDLSALQVEYPTCTLVREMQHRRRGWSGGTSIRLADGMDWRLPKLDLALLATTPGMANALGKAFDLADEVQRQAEGSQDYARALMIYHTHMANIGVQLLQVNYELPDPLWRRLFRFKNLADMLVMTLKISQEIADSVPIWIPFFLTDGADGQDNLLLN